MELRITTVENGFLVHIHKDRKDIGNPDLQMRLVFSKKAHLMKFLYKTINDLEGP